ncbi:Lrp/AsnC family transcriptional regulator, partial [Faecalibaculum rodentium]
MNTNALLDLLEKDARLSARDLADMLDEEEGTVRKEVKRLENDKIICGYHTVINYNRG